MRRKVFISYKRKVDAASSGDSEALADVLRAQFDPLLYEVFIDKEIVGSTVWNTVIAKNLATCDGAVVLLSEGALASSWVQHELSVLSHRKKTGEPPIHLHIVVLDGGLLEKLQQPPFDAMGITTDQLYVPAKKLGVVQAANEFADEPSLVGVLVNKLFTALPNRQSATDLQLKRIAKYLAAFPEALDQLEALFTNPPASSDTRVRVSTLAENLLEAAPAVLVKVVQVLNAEADGVAEALHKVRKLVELVFPNWVSAEAAATLAMAAATGSFGVLNAEESWTCGQYVRRAEGSPSNYWEVVELHETGTERSLVEQAALLVADKHLGSPARKALDAVHANGKARFDKVLDEEVGYKRYFPIVRSVAEAEALLALGRFWLSPLLVGDQDENQLGQRGVRLLPRLAAQEEPQRRGRYDVLLQQIDGNEE